MVIQLGVTVKFKDKDMGLKRIIKDVKLLNGSGVKVGIMGNDTINNISVVDYAMYNEFGTSRIPARPFMSTTYDRNLDDVSRYLDYLANQVIDGKMTVMAILNQLGLYYTNKVKMTIRDAKNWAVPNAASTIAMKGSSSPLIDTGRMVGAVNYEIQKK